MEWISVKDDIPGDDGAVLTWFVNEMMPEGDFCLMIYDVVDGTFLAEDLDCELFDFTDQVTHWRPLLAPPS